MNSFGVLGNEQCDVEIHNIQQEKKWIKKKKTKQTNDDDFLEREFQRNKKRNIAKNIAKKIETDKAEKEKIARDNVLRTNIIQKEIRWRRRFYKNNIKRNVFHQWEKETNNEIEYKINQKMKWVMHKKNIYIPKIYFNGWKYRYQRVYNNMIIFCKWQIALRHFRIWKNMQKCPICIGNIQDKYVTSCNHKFCTSCISRWLCTKQTCPMCRTNIVATETSIEKGSLLATPSSRSHRTGPQDDEVYGRRLFSRTRLWSNRNLDTIFRRT